mmetsp:Transcript_62326/g.197387  ORF Transcript_62326/g.197387 Transcript_62326/m.197387 type:complete len:590 (-) Transcript_62326:666-2435(-)
MVRHDHAIATRTTTALLGVILDNNNKGRNARRNRGKDTEDNVGEAIDVLARRFLHHIQSPPKTTAEKKSAEEIKGLFDERICLRVVDLLGKATPETSVALLSGITFLLSIGTAGTADSAAGWRQEVRRAGGIRRLSLLAVHPNPSVSFQALRVLANFFRHEPLTAADINMRGLSETFVVAFREAQDEKQQLILLQLLEYLAVHAAQPPAAPSPPGAAAAGHDADAAGGSAPGSPEKPTVDPFLECAVLLRVVVSGGAGKQMLHWLRRSTEAVAEAVLDLLLLLEEPAPLGVPMPRTHAATELSLAVCQLNAVPPILELLGRPLGEDCLALGAQLLASLCCGLDHIKKWRKQGKGGARQLPAEDDGREPINHGRTLVDGHGIPVVLRLVAESSQAAQLHALRVLAWCSAKHPEARAEVRRNGGLRMLERMLTAGGAGTPHLSFSALPKLPPLPAQQAGLARYVMTRCVPSLGDPVDSAASPPEGGSMGDDPGSLGASTMSVVSEGSEEAMAVDSHVMSMLMGQGRDAGPVLPSSHGAEWGACGFQASDDEIDESGDDLDSGKGEEGGEEAQAKGSMVLLHQTASEVNLRV